MGRNRKGYISVHTRLPLEVVEALDAMTASDCARYETLRRVVINSINGLPAAHSIPLDKIRELGAVADMTGFRSVAELVSHLAAAFLRVYRFNNGLLRDDESTPDEEIRDMFDEFQIKKYYDKELSIKKSVK